jgi:hypothetical protein
MPDAQLNDAEAERGYFQLGNNSVFVEHLANGPVLTTRSKPRSSPDVGRNSLRCRPIHHLARDSRVLDGGISEGEASLMLADLRGRREHVTGSCQEGF